MGIHYGAPGDLDGEARSGSRADAASARNLDPHLLAQRAAFPRESGWVEAAQSRCSRSTFG